MNNDPSSDRLNGELARLNPDPVLLAQVETCLLEPPASHAKVRKPVAAPPAAADRAEAQTTLPRLLPAPPLALEPRLGLEHLGHGRGGAGFADSGLSVPADGDVQPTPDERMMILALPSTPPLDRNQPITASWRPGEVW